MLQADNVELGKLAVYFCLQKSYISSCLVGMGSTKILKLNLDAAFNNISDEEKQVLNRIKQRCSILSFQHVESLFIVSLQSF